MSQLVDHIADLTGFRDRDVLDVTLVGAMKDLLRPNSVTIYRRVGEVGAEHWLTRARLTADAVVATADPVWAELDTLPALADHPHRYQAMLAQQMVQLTDQVPCITVFPVSTDRDVVGVLEIESDEPLSAESQRLVGGILRVYRNFQGLLDYSERDTLTGLLNRKTFDEAFLKASAEQNISASDGQGDRRAAAHIGNTWLGVIDIDHFKRVNDNYGHLIGDEVLLLLSRLMRASFRFHDRLYRFGGEEFVVLMRCDEATDAAHAFERLRSNTEAYVFPQVGRITVSVGFTVLKLGDTPSGAFERADRAVYYAKEHGRNRVCSYAELLEQGELTEDDDKTGDVELF